MCEGVAGVPGELGRWARASLPPRLPEPALLLLLAYLGPRAMLGSVAGLGVQPAQQRRQGGGLAVCSLRQRSLCWAAQGAPQISSSCSVA